MTLTLVLTNDNPSNTSIVNQATGEVLFQVSTEHDNKRSTTLLTDATNRRTIASWEWRDVQSDLLKIGDADPIPLNSWLHKSKVPLKDSATFKDDQNREYEWKGFGGLANQVEMYTMDDTQNPIVVSPKSVVGNPTTLTLEPRAQEILHLVLISFLMQEKTRRIHEKTSVSTAAGGAAWQTAGEGLY